MPVSFRVQLGTQKLHQIFELEETQYKELIAWKGKARLVSSPRD